MEIALIPRWFIGYLSDNISRQYHINILISNILIMTFIVLFRNSLISTLNVLPHFCLFDKLFGFECPVCGITRSLCEIVKGNFSNALSLNCSSFFVVAYIVFQIPLRIIALINSNHTAIVDVFSKYFGNIVLIIILINWTFKIAVYLI